MRITSVTKEYIDTIWPTVAQLLLPAEKYNNGRYGIGDIYKGIMANKYQLWLAYEPLHKDAEIYAAVVTQVVNYPTGKRICNILFVGGFQMKLWLKDMNDIIEEWAKKCGCSAIEGTGRKGWIKALQKYGGKINAVLLEREI